MTATAAGRAWGDAYADAHAARFECLEALARGCRLAVLGPTPDGDALYRALGFERAASPARRWFYVAPQ
jgi:hypothetical protein